MFKAHIFQNLKRGKNLNGTQRSNLQKKYLVMLATIHTQKKMKSNSLTSVSDVEENYLRLLVKLFYRCIQTCSLVLTFWNLITLSQDLTQFAVINLIPLRQIELWSPIRKRLIGRFLMNSFDLFNESFLSDFFPRLFHILTFDRLWHFNTILYIYNRLKNLTFTKVLTKDTWGNNTVLHFNVY